MAHNAITPNDDPLIEALLVQLARLYALRAVPAGWQRPGDLDRPLSKLARQLADDGVLVILGARSGAPPEAVPQLVREVVLAYTALYALLTRALLAGLTGIKPYYYSYSRSALVIFFVAEAAPVIQALAGYVAPYAAVHPAGAPIRARELGALMDAVLGQLETGGMDRARYQALRSNGAAIISWMLGRPLRQLPLLVYDAPLFAARPAPPPSPPTLPGIAAAGDETTTLAMPAPPPDGQDNALPPLPSPRPQPGTPPAPLPYRPPEPRNPARRP
ncbi:MAG: hypothetical protein ACUVSX_11490 [Aggregatilineales bacterium]